MQADRSMNRSWLYVPGDRPDRVAKALQSSADAVIVDLEDAVRPGQREFARSTALAAATMPRVPGIEMWVRINAGDAGRRDLAAIAGVHGLDGLVLAKCESADWIAEVASATPEAWLLSPLVETARAVRDIDSIMSAPRIGPCHLGEVDLLADLRGAPPTGQGLIDAARVTLVIASAAAGNAPPVGGVHLQLADLDALASTSAELAQLGFGGRAVVHPDHCAVVNEMFSPSAADVAWALSVLEAAASADGGVVRAADGSMVDEAVLRRARWIMGRE
jgi:citrate lyase subunit beta/citryl-CoA lyase